jgi:hypothetical protein
MHTALSIEHHHHREVDEAENYSMMLILLLRAAKITKQLSSSGNSLTSIPLKTVLPVLPIHP